MSKRKRTDVEVMNEGLSDRKKALPTQETNAVAAVLVDAMLLRLVTSYQRGIPVLFPMLAIKHGITPENVKAARESARESGGLTSEGCSVDFVLGEAEMGHLEQLKRMQASYMEMAIKDNDLHVLKLVYAIHKQGISSEHPRFGFRKPMRVAAAHGRLDILKWLSEQEENDEWFEDRWLLDAAFKSFDIDVVRWVHEVYSGVLDSVVRWKALDEIAGHGALELLQWALTTFPDAQLTTNAMDGAAANGHLEMVKYLHSGRKEGCTTAAMNEAAGNGHLSVVEFLHTHRNEGCTVRAMNSAAGNGHLDVVKFLHENREEGCTNMAMDEAATNGHLEVIRFLHTSRTEGCTERGMDWAIRNGHLDIVRYLHEHQCCLGDYTTGLQIALIRRHLSVVRFVCEHFHTDISAAALQGAKSEDLLEMIHVFEGFNVDGWTTDVMDHAASVGSLEALEYLYSHRTEGCTTKAMDNAASQGHLDVVKFLHENRSEGCSKRAMNGAAANGSLGVVKYLHEHRTEGCTSHVIIGAVQGGHFEVVKFLLEHCDVSVPDNAVLCAAEIGHWELLELLFQVQFPVHFIQIMTLLAEGGHLDSLKKIFANTPVNESVLGKCLIEAACNGHWYEAKFLLAEIRRVQGSSHSTGSYYWFSAALEGAALCGDIDMAELLISTKHQFWPSQPHGFINTTILGNLDLLEMLEKARRGDVRWNNEVNDDIGEDTFEDSDLHWRSVQDGVAAAQGNLEILMWLHQQSFTFARPSLLDYGAASGELDVIRYILEAGRYIVVTSDSIENATQHSQLHVLKYLYERWKDGPCEVPLLDVAAESASLDVVKFVHEQCPEETCTASAMTFAASRGQLDIVRFLHQHRSEGCTVKTMDAAAGHNQLTVLRFLHSHRHEGCTTAAMNVAASVGHLNIVKFLHENRKEGCTTDAMDQAALNGHLATVRYLHQHRTEGCTEDAMKDAAARGHFHVIKFLHEFRSEGCTTAALVCAASNRHLTIARFLHDNRTEGCTKDALDWAIRTKNLSMVKFLYENRSEGYHEAVIEEACKRDPDDIGLVQQYLRPKELKTKKSRQLFLEKCKFERAFKRGRFAPERRADESDDGYDSEEESDEWRFA
ncbi:hypothetical protein Poli38472_013681 [Pythium oligandrum]|uniref:Ankyrin repeat protein n=1 Tax=Pythium oligandrum TaxID=41045 RepID=A0A8K1CDW6_PYTOL|nr:hypothetical protein Poli38472_013681 [Pythium oligandrum]|eukprot:TMW61218.1 hypothetical protein Poli38472_013681 [Pythium oligandrum]